jgi:hypothetical protein
MAGMPGISAFDVAFMVTLDPGLKDTHGSLYAGASSARAAVAAVRHTAAANAPIRMLRMPSSRAGKFLEPHVRPSVSHGEAIARPHPGGAAAGEVP